MKSSRNYPVYTVNKHAEGLLVGGHPWVYENDILGSPEAEPENGTLVDVVSTKGAYLGTGFLSLKSKIRVRLISRNANDTFDAAFWKRRVEYAWAYRKTVLEPADLTACRVIFGEADQFPGLTVDRFNNILVTQTLSVGMEKLKPILFPLLVQVLRADGQTIEGIYERNDEALRAKEGLKYKNINKSQKVKKLEKQKRRLQRSISRSYEKNKKGESYCKTNNVIKKEKLLLKRNHRLTNIRKNYLNQTISEIVNRKPRFICIEDLNVSGMMKNRHLSKAVQAQGFFWFRKQLEYRCSDKGIQLIVADRFYPSSKLCSCCGNIKKDLKLSDRVYRCACGNMIDRDFQASINLKTYGEKFAG